MGLMTGKNVVIFGVANKRSIAWGIAQALHREGAKLALAYQNDRMGDAVKKLAAEFDEPPFLLARVNWWQVDNRHMRCSMSHSFNFLRMPIV